MSTESSIKGDVSSDKSWEQQNLTSGAAEAQPHKHTSIAHPNEASPRSTLFEDSNGPKRIEAQQQQFEYPGSKTLSFIVLGLSVAVFLLSVDRTIVTTALPYISNEFHAFANFGWYGSAYLLSSSVLQLLFGRIFDLFDLKWTFLSALAIFEVGSVVCATATTSTAFIVGRAVAGVGSAGVLSGSFVIVVHSVPLEKRPLYTAGIGIFYSLGSIAGPLLGGVFTSKVTWRWCFWLNLPVGALSAFTMLFFKPKKLVENSEQTLMEKLAKLDILGSVLLLGSTLMLFVALDDVNTGAKWGSSIPIGLLAGSGATMIAFVCWQIWRKDKALVPPSILRGRTVPFACINATCLYSTLLLHIYYLSIWFQAIQSRSALETGVYLLPYIATSAVATFAAGFVTTKTGYFAPPAWIGCAIATAGAGLLIGLQPHESTANWVGFFIISGFGTGFAVQQGFTAVQRILPLHLAALGSTVITFGQTFGGAVFVMVGNTIVIEELRQARIPGVDVLKVVSLGATAFERLVPSSSRFELRMAYAESLRDVLILATVTAGLAFLSSLGLEMKSLKKFEAQGVEGDESSSEKPEQAEF